MRAAELERQGHPTDRARETALAEFGDISDARRFCRAEDERRVREYRRTLYLDNVRQDLVLALRAARRQPAFVLSTVLTLGIAIGLAASAYGIVHAYLVRPLPYPDAERLVRVRATPSAASLGLTSVGPLRALTDRAMSRHRALASVLSAFALLALSLALTRLLASQLYGVTPTNPGTFAGIVALLGASALIASLAPIRQAARVHPAEVMRSE